MGLLTVCRSSEVRHATRDEVALEAETQTVPVTRMKAQRDHRVPLSRRALGILNEARGLANGSGLVLPATHGGVIGDNTASKLTRGLWIEAVPYGFRSSFRDWVGECSDGHCQTNQAGPEEPAIKAYQAAS